MADDRLYTLVATEEAESRAVRIDGEERRRVKLDPVTNADLIRRARPRPQGGHLFTLGPARQRPALAAFASTPPLVRPGPGPLNTRRPASLSVRS